jgi:hypothetical protein
MAKSIKKTAAKSAAKSSKKVASKKSAKASARKAVAKKTVVPRRSDDAKLTWMSKENPGREGSAAYKMFEAAKACKTIGAYKEKVAKIALYNGHESIMLRNWSERGLLKIAVAA